MAQKARSHSSTLSIHSSISLYHVSHNIDCVNIKPKEKHTVKRAKIDAQKNTKNEQHQKQATAESMNGTVLQEQTYQSAWILNVLQSDRVIKVLVGQK